MIGIQEFCEQSESPCLHFCAATTRARAMFYRHASMRGIVAWYRGMLRKRCSKTSRHRKKYSPAPLTVTTRPRGLERPRRRRRSEPFSTPKRHFLTENGRPARPLEDPSCTQRQAGKVEPRAWEAQAQSRAAWSALAPRSLNCTCTLRLRQKATLIFPVVTAHLQSHASSAQNAQGISHALVQQG